MTTIPTINEIYTNLVGEIQTRTGVTLSTRRKVVLRAIARAVALLVYLLYVRLGKEQANTAPDTADRPALIRWGMMLLGRPPYPATQGIYTATVTGTTGAVIAAGTTYKSDDTADSPGKLFVLPALYTLPGSTGTVSLRALEPGTGSKLGVGNTLTATRPIANVNAGATVTAETTTPLDGEELSIYRGIVIAALRLRSGSWSAVDYRQVGSNVLGVAQIYAYPVSGVPGNVNVFIEATESVATDRVPTLTIINGVEAAIEAVRPMTTVNVNYLAIVPKAVVITVTQVATLSTEQRATILAAMKEALNGVRPFIAAADVLAERLDSISTTYASTYSLNIQSVIAGAIPGVPFGTVTMTVGGTLVTGYNFDNGEIPNLTAINYV